jgi:subfamily B ATP-binding cassette protein MsbA
MNSFKRIATLTRPYWPRICGGIILSLMVSGITAAIAWLVKPALDELLVEKRYEYIAFIPAGIVLLFSLKGILSFGQTYLMKSAGMKLVRETRNRLFNHIIHLPVGYFNRESSGKIISRVMYDVELLNNLVSTGLKSFVMAVPTVIFLLGVAFYRSWNLTLMMLLLFPIIGYSTKKFGKGVKKKRKAAQRKISVITHKVGEAILGTRIIKVFNSEKSMGEKFKKENQKFYREMLRVIRLKEFTRLVIDVSTGIGVAIAMWYGFSLVVSGSITAGDLASMLVAIYMIFSPVKKIGDSYNSFQESRAAIERIDTLMFAETEEQGETGIDEFSKSIRFDNVSFTYPGTEIPVLKNIELEILSGEVLAIVGQSGAGKSTLVDLIPKFHAPSGGVIAIDGRDMNDVSLQALRKLMGIVSQDIILFDDTVRENIAFGRPEASEEEIVAAAKMAYADDFIREFPDQYDTEIGERGLKLSGGQRQRIAIARAILKNPPILILDEATSSLDSVSEALVQKALDGLMKGRTTVVIAHRLSTIRNADRIVILDKGRIIDTGTHDQLIARNDTYMKLYNAFALA